ncbi:MAG: short-chain dehydrogenase/reductase [Sphingomonadales bacterium]|nr:short-chain dehydrogenase/reductase [Sphingomonadales bacterium]
MQISFDGKVALVTGAAKGIGKEIARALCGSGAYVVICDIDDVAGQAIAAELSKTGRSEYRRCDVSSDGKVEALLASIEAEVGHVDILVNNAGVISTGPIDTISANEWDRVFAINTRSAFLLTKGVLPGMRTRAWGRIITIASVAAQAGGGFLGNTCYAASKGALISFAKGVAREGGGDNVTSNVICPGMINTEITQTLDAAQREMALSAIPMHRPAEPDEVARAVLFLASDLASYVNGVTLNVDGGLIRH